MALTSGQVLQDRYRIASLLGQGGMGAVYRAWDSRLDVPVALKEMTSQLDLNPQTLAQLRQQFQQEAQILARLNHPHLVRVGDFFEGRDNAYLVMDFVEGESLADIIKREGAMAEPQVVAWAGQLLKALAYCHSQGIIHRDVKPQNVIIRPDGQAVLVDFGLVKLWDPNDPRTRTAMRGMGTPEYAPPEQYDVEMGHTDTRSDVYSLGATLYHALTGQAPPTATLRIADPARFVTPRATMPKISLTTEKAVLKALELARSQRWQSAAEMGEALGITGLPAPAQLPDRDAPAVPVSEKTKVMPGAPSAAPSRRSIPGCVWALVGLAALALVIGLLVGGGAVITRIVTGRGVAAPTTPAVETALPVTPSSVGETDTPSPSPAPSATATRTLTRMPTGTPVQTPTHAPSPTQRATATPLTTATPRATAATATSAPQAATQPALVAPASGGEYNSPVTCQWSGSLGTGQAYQVTLYHPESMHTIQSDLLTTQSWTTALPGETGEWRWRVSVMENGMAVTTSPEGMFWYNPFPGGGDGGGGGANTPAPP